MIKESAYLSENETPDEGQQENERKRKRRTREQHRQCLQAMLLNYSVEIARPSLVDAAK